MAANNSNPSNNNTTTNINDDNTLRYQCFVEIHPPRTRNPRHFQVPATIHPFHGLIVELELFHLWLDDTENQPMDFFRGPRTGHRVDVYWDPPLGEFIRYHHNQVLYFDYSVITPDPYPDRTQDSYDNHSTPPPPPICVNSTSSRSSSPVSPHTRKNNPTSPSLRPSKSVTDRNRRDPYSYLWKLVAYSGGLNAHLQKQRQHRGEKLKELKELKEQQQQVQLVVYMYGDEFSQQQQQQQQHQSQQQPQQYQSPQQRQSQSQSQSPQQQQQPLNRGPVLVHSFTHYGQRSIYRRQNNNYHHQSQRYSNHVMTSNYSQGYNNQHSQSYNHPGHVQSHCQSQGFNQGQCYNQTRTSHTHNHNHNHNHSYGHGHNQPQSYTNPSQFDNYTQTYNDQAPTNYLSQATMYAQTLDQLQVFNYRSPTGDRLVQEHLEECRWSAAKFEIYLNNLHSKLGGQSSTVPHPPPPPPPPTTTTTTTTTVVSQGQDSPVAGDDGRNQGQGQGRPETEQEEMEEKLETQKKEEEEKGRKVETE